MYAKFLRMIFFAHFAVKCVVRQISKSSARPRTKFFARPDGAIMP